MYRTYYSCQISMKLEVSRQTFEKYASNFVKICPVGAALFHADRQMDKTELIVVFRTYANFCKNLSNVDTFLNLLCPKRRWVQLLLS